MDDAVLAAIKRWPDVPAVSGWLSLDERGRWRLHPNGDADQGGPGEGIGSDAILGFIDRNYARDDDGRWFFQNGPQRVYVRLDAAPYILRVGADGAGLQTHTGLAVRRVAAWWLDEDGRLYADTDAGPGMVAGRDMPRVLDALVLEDGSPALDSLAALPAGATLAVSYQPPGHARAGLLAPVPLTPPTPLTHATRARIAQALGYATGR
ncbi:DUF2946 family protein [Achromobacter aloeverae]|uniref:DUF2946 domain-containing protein n=1 Tax=Achromobacter aloeverae TaxID=1750518 RepID=A0A4Q1HE30_9BURK|nr:DUF2946 family protein [Achromobacter aloeverae]RXN83312.1 DUF2946 domain-containing protein [Achromobacter aloeverae]